MFTGFRKGLNRRPISGSFRGRMISLHEGRGSKARKPAEKDFALKLTVAGTEYRMGDGEWLLWDDTFQHEVRNDTAGIRIALLLDIRRRGMPLDLEILTRILIAGTGAAIRMRRWA